MAYGGKFYQHCWEIIKQISSIDGSALGNPGKIGAGIIIRDHNGNFIHAISSPLGTGTNNQAEVQAAHIGLSWCIEQGYTKIHLEADSSILIHWLTNNTTTPWNMFTYVQKLKDMCNLCEEITFTHVFREANYPADSLSKLSHTLTSLIHYQQLESLPSSIRGQILQDQNGTPSFRHKLTKKIQLPPHMSHFYSHVHD
ncbi:PREDICTED: uncharacterized protein LOC109219984 [Nicotiana attenuata]|uniref:uncharacterized protein LOC109219984 n=1 Tax=Nicotiana attenuata TaxID=49451 RepID=UPI000904FAFD|nr:PREDICTED: uncharacterized protein LOC109219984 [Nicotiana attenuata]